MPHAPVPALSVIALVLAACASATEVVEHGSTSTGADEGTSSTSMDLADSSTGEDPPTCCGCLCVDDHWSCSSDTCVHEDGTAAGLVAEAGFFELDASGYEFDGRLFRRPRHRVWYAFRPADVDPENKPLVLLFNGGPNFSTGLLFSYNTGRYTIDPDRTGDRTHVETAEPWTRFANLLYVDSPATGFSYPLEEDDGTRGDLAFDPDADAGAFVRVLLRFLARHPAIRDNQVILLGESYGGIRATLMLEQILRPAALLDGRYVDVELHDEIAGHHAAVFGDAEVAPAVVARQFAGQVLIQPAIVGLSHRIDTDEFVPGCLSNSDLYQCDEPDGWAADRTQLAAERLVQLDVLEGMLGVDPRSIAWLRPEARAGAYGRALSAAPESELTAELGSLGAEDSYYVAANDEVISTGDARAWATEGSVPEFLRNVAHVRTLVTNASRDLIVWTDTLPEELAAYPDVGVTIERDDAARPGIARPGWIRVGYAPDAFDGVDSVELRFPRYAAAGHMVTVREPEHLLADMAAWIAAD